MEIVGGFSGRPAIFKLPYVLSFEPESVNDETLKPFQSASDNLTYVNLATFSIGGSGLKYLSHLPLVTLNLNKTTVLTVEPIATGRSKNLQNLYLNDTNIAPQGLAGIVKLSNLRSL